MVGAGRWGGFVGAEVMCFCLRRILVKNKDLFNALSVLDLQFVVPEFFPFELSWVCSTSCGKAFILKVYFVLADKDFKSEVEWKTKTCLGVCRISDFWGAER